MSAEKRARELLAALTKIRDSTFRDAASLRGIADLAINSDRAGDYALTPQWQDISTAPKDGSKVLIWRAGWDFAPLARWDFVEDDESGELFGGWVFDEFLTIGVSNGFLGWKEDIEDGHMPTHYLPAPPEGEA